MTRVYPNGRLVHRLEALESFERRQSEYQRESAPGVAAPSTVAEPSASPNVIQFPGTKRAKPTVNLQSPTLVYLDGDVEVLTLMQGLGSVGLRFVSVNDGEGERYAIVRADRGDPLH